VLDNLNQAIVTLAATHDEYALVRVESSQNPRFWTKAGFSRLLPGGL
jgi:predicted transglutaminase-like cysteine proteinase